MLSRMVDITGQKFGMLTAVEPIEKNLSVKNRSQYWKCLCDCGKECSVLGTSLRTDKQKSCGCIRKTQAWGDNLSKRKTKPRVERALNTLYYSYQASALKRGFKFDLSMEDFQTYLESSCFYCGTTKSNVLNISTSREERYYSYNGIDRRDNTLGYFKGNCVSCCRMCNTAKMKHSELEFLDWIKRVYSFNFPST